MAAVTTNLGVITAYGDAVAAGYTGTKAEWQALMASYATVAEQAQESADAAAQSAIDADNAKSDAITAKNNAETAKNDAITAKNDAVTAKNDAQTAKTDAEKAKDDAQDIVDGINAKSAKIDQNTAEIEDLKSDLKNTTDAIYAEIGVKDVNFFDTNNKFNAYINGASTITANNSNRLAWVKLMPNSAYAFTMTKKANTDFQFMLCDTVPAAGVTGTGKYTVADSETSVAYYFNTDSKYVYVAFKYWATGATTYTESEVLSSISIVLTENVIDQIATTKKELSNVINTVANELNDFRISMPFVRGWLSSGNFVNNSKSFATEMYISTADVDFCVLNGSSLLSYILYYDDNHAYTTVYATITKNKGKYEIDKTYPYFRVSLGYTDSSEALPNSAIEQYAFYKNVISDKNVTVTGDNFTDMWVLGGINSSTGALNYSSNVTYISPSLIDKRIKSVMPNTGYFVALFAYANSGYVGVYNGSEFTKTYAVRTVEIDIKKLRNDYPTYDYRLLIGAINTSDINEIRKNIVFLYDSRSTDHSIKANDVRRTLEQARNIRKNVGKPLTLVHFSDIHGNADRLRDIVNFGESYSAQIDDIICTGDIVGGQFSDGISFWTETTGAEKILTCIGNHDAVTAQTGGTLIDMSTLCDTFITPFISNWGTVVHPSDTTYYYKDYADQAVRLIVLDCMHDDADQLTWLETALSDALTNELHVLIGIHYPSYPRNIVPCNFSPAKDLGNYDTATISASIINAVDLFQNNGGDFIAYLTGHEHSDAILTVNNYPNQLVINITCATNVNAQWYNSDQYRFGSFSNAYNVMTINTNTKTVSIKRIGADMDMFLRDRKAFCYDYGTHTLLN